VIRILQNDGTWIDNALSFSGYGTKVKRELIVPDHTNKMRQIMGIVDALCNGNIPLLFDVAMSSCSHKSQILMQSNVHYFKELESAAALFFTSGTGGNSIGVVKTQAHLQYETSVHKEWLKNEAFQQCLVTVPFFHIYGFLFGLSVPLALGLDIVTKEHFLPNEIINLCLEKSTLCITNPVFIRAMLRLREGVNLSQTLFISSSGPLESFEASAFESKYSTRLIQLYGSSETGGIAIRSGDNSVWKPLDGVNVSSDDGLLCVESPFLSEWIYDQKFEKITFPHRTTDVIERSEDGFKIIGRSSELVKIGGKRLSIVEIEMFLEEIDGIKEALGFVEYHPQLLRGETLSLYLVGDETKINKTILKKALHDQFGGIHIESKITMVEKIEKTSIGKKIRSRIIT
jgi:acyl-coenzyme A synthetase/AMP-(fatty) acid ligase